MADQNRSNNTQTGDELAAEIRALEASLYEQTLKLNELKRQRKGTPVADHTFQSLCGPVTLSTLFGPHDRLLAIFGPGDLYCSQWNLLGLAGLTEADWTPQ